MAEFCKNCGTEIPEVAQFCPNCGEMKMPAPVEPVKKQNRVRWWMIVIPVVLVIALTAVLLFGPLYVRIAPTAVLTKAAQNTAADLGMRSSGSLWELLGTAYDDTLKSTVEMSCHLTDSGESMELDLNTVMQMDAISNQSTMDLSIILSAAGVGENLRADFSSYVDSEVMALNMKQGTGTDYYGIRYDTFSEDVRQNDLIYSALGEENLLMVEEIVTMLADALRSSGDLYENGQPQISDAYANVLMAHFTEMKPTVASEKIDVDGTSRKTNKITYAYTDADMGALMMDLLDILEDDDYFRTLYEASPELQEDGTEMSWEAYIDSARDAAEELVDSDGSTIASFYIYNQRVVAVGLVIESEDDKLALDVNLGENAGTGDILIALESEMEDETLTSEICLSSEISEKVAKESIALDMSVTTKDDGKQKYALVLGYEWEKEDGDLTIDLSFEGDEEEPVDMTLNWMLYAEEKGYALEIPDLIADIASLDEDLAESADGMHCGIRYSIYSGAEIETPDFVNIGDVTQDMLYDVLFNLYNSYAEYMVS